MTTELVRRRLGPHVEVWEGLDRGRYPHGNTVVVTGTAGALAIDPSLSLVAGTVRPRVTGVLNSHCHEDHVAGNHLFPAVPWHVPRADALGIQSIDGLLEIYGFSPRTTEAWRRALVERFHYTPRPDPVPFDDGAVFDLGGCTIRVLAAPGHTRGHACLLIEPDGVLYLGDIDLSSFGPYYGDAWSDLAQFRATLQRVGRIDAAWYVTFHHIGVIEGAAAFRERLARFAAVIDHRETRLRAFLHEPRSLAEMVAHRFIYRPGDAVDFADDVERRSLRQHLDAFLASGTAEALPDGRFIARAVD